MARVIHATDTDSTLNDEDKLEVFTEAVDDAALLGKFRMVEQLYAHQPSSVDCDTARVAGLTSDLPLLKWIKANNPGLFNSAEKETAFYVAVERGYMETVQWLVSAFPDTVWPLPPGVGQPEVTKWLQDEYVNLDALAAPQPSFMELSKRFVRVRERLHKKLKTRRALIVRNARLRAKKRTLEEAGIVDG